MQVEGKKSILLSAIFIVSIEKKRSIILAFWMNDFNRKLFQIIFLDQLEVRTEN